LPDRWVRKELRGEFGDGDQLDSFEKRGTMQSSGDDKRAEDADKFKEERKKRKKGEGPGGQGGRRQSVGFSDGRRSWETKEDRRAPESP